MNVSAILYFLLVAGAIQGFIFNIATFLARKKIEKPVVFLNLLVLVLSLNNLQSWLIEKGFVPDFLYLKYFVFPWYVLILPMFYAFLIYYLGIEKKRMPFLGLTIAVVALELVARTIVLVFIDSGALDIAVMPMYNAIEDALTLLYSMFIFAKAIQLIFKFPDLYPDILTYDDLAWVKRFIKWGALIFVLWGIAVLLNIFSDTIKAPYSYYPLRIASSVLIYWIGYQAFFRYIVLKDRIVLRKEIRSNTSDKQVPVEVAVEVPKQIDKAESDFRDINVFIKANQKYLDPYLSLEGLAEELEIGTSSLSKMINTYSGSSFPDYINKLRVEEAKKLLGDPEFDAYTIVAIGLECGFNSKSTFMPHLRNSCFKPQQGIEKAKCIAFSIRFYWNDVLNLNVLYVF